jgi:hypothetical protein
MRAVGSRAAVHLTRHILNGGGLGGAALTGGTVAPRS